MSTLLEMYQEEGAVHTATAPAALGDMADAVVRAARRRRAARVGSRAAVAVVAVGVLAGGAWNAWGGAEVVPAQSPSADLSAPWPSPAGVADPRLPQAEPMDALDWDQLDTSWDVELGAYMNYASGMAGSAMAVYLTPPGGDRILGYTDAQFPLARPVMLSFDLAAKNAMIFDAETKQVALLRLETGELTVIDNEAYAGLDSAQPLGRTSSGDSVWTTQSVAADGTLNQILYSMDGEAYQGVVLPGDNPSPVWGNIIVYGTPAGLSVRNVYGDTSTSLGGTEGCVFGGWTRQGTFVALCDREGTDSPDRIEVDPATDSQQAVPAADMDRPGPDEFSGNCSAIDTQRFNCWADRSGQDMQAPTVYDGDLNAVNLDGGFVSTPNSYAVIFGVRATG